MFYDYYYDGDDYVLNLLDKWIDLSFIYIINSD